MCAKIVSGFLMCQSLRVQHCLNHKVFPAGGFFFLTITCQLFLFVLICAINSLQRKIKDIRLFKVCNTVKIYIWWKLTDSLFRAAHISVLLFQLTWTTYASLPTVQLSKSGDCRKHCAVSFAFETNHFCIILAEGMVNLNFVRFTFNKGPVTSLTDCQTTKWQEEFPIIGIVVTNKWSHWLKRRAAEGKWYGVKWNSHW